MFTVLSIMRSRRPMHPSPRLQRPAPICEGLEGRLLFAFNAYIAGLASGAPNSNASFVFSTTGQPAKQWVVTWGDGSQPETFPAPTGGFTTPQTFTHHYGPIPADYAVTATATSITDVTLQAVPLGENSAFGNGGGTGKEVVGMPDANSTGTNIASVVDENNNTYVLTIDNKRMAVTRFTPGGLLDTGSGWVPSGTFVLTDFTGVNNTDIPKAMTIDKTNHFLFVCGSSNNRWVIERINISTIRTTAEAWKTIILGGTANALFLDTSDVNRLGVAGTNTSGEIEMAVLFTQDVPQSPPDPTIPGGSLDTSFAPPNGFVAAPNSIYQIPTPYTVSASASAIVEGDDVGFPGSEEWFISGTVSYCNGVFPPMAPER